jgi:hypothetical protein
MKQKPSSSQRPSRRKTKPGPNRKAKKMSKIAQEDPAATIIQLKALRDGYNSQSEPIKSISQKLDKAVRDETSVDKIILNGISLNPHEMYAITTSFSSYSVLHSQL